MSTRFFSEKQNYDKHISEKNMVRVNWQNFCFRSFFPVIFPSKLTKKLKLFLQNKKSKNLVNFISVSLKGFYELKFWPKCIIRLSLKNYIRFSDNRSHKEIITICNYVRTHFFVWLPALLTTISFCTIFKIRRYLIGCINTIVGLFSELLMRLSI